MILLILIFGALSAYGEAPTVGTLAYREEMGQISHREYDFFIAVPDCDLIGQQAILAADDVLYEGIVFDCAGDSDSYRWMKDNIVAGEVDYWFWQEHPELIGSEVFLLIGGNVEITGTQTLPDVRQYREIRDREWHRLSMP